MFPPKKIYYDYCYLWTVFLKNIPPQIFFYCTNCNGNLADLLHSSLPLDHFLSQHIHTSSKKLRHNIMILWQRSWMVKYASIKVPLFVSQCHWTSVVLIFTFQLHPASVSLTLFYQPFMVSAFTQFDHYKRQKWTAWFINQQTKMIQTTHLILRLAREIEVF